MSLRTTIARAATALIACGLVATTMGCGKRCDTADGCVKQCNCNDTANSVVIACQITFNCEPEGKVCDPGYDQGCDEFCKTYAAIDACGSRQCTEDSHCIKRCNCQSQTGDVVLCSAPFACNKEHSVCESAHRDTPCDTICTACGVILPRDI